MRAISVGMLLFFLSIINSWAGGIRTIEVNSKEMRNIYLKMGQSTVLRFRERPKKVVLGNSNYHHVEFIENDLTIQPQANVPTNMFVYGEYHTFGFNLKMGTSHFDDLVNVRWKSQALPKFEPKKNKTLRKTVKTVGESFAVGKDVEITIKEVRQNPGIGSTIVDCEVKNTGKTKLHTKDLKLLLTRNRAALSGQMHVFLDLLIDPKKSTKLRFFVRPMQKIGFSLEAKYQSHFSKKIISRRFL